MIHGANKWSVLQYASMVTQFGFLIITPILLCVMAANYFISRFSLDSWVMLVAIILGLISGISSGFSFLRHFLKRSATSQNDERGR